MLLTIQGSAAQEAEQVLMLFADSSRRATRQAFFGWLNWQRYKLKENQMQLTLALTALRGRCRHLADQQLVISRAVAVLIQRSGQPSLWKNWDQVVDAAKELQGLGRFWQRLYSACGQVAWRFFVEPWQTQCETIAEQLHAHAGPRYQAVLANPSQDSWALQFKQVKLIQKLSVFFAEVGHGSCLALGKIAELDDVQYPTAGRTKTEPMPSPVATATKTLRARCKKLGISNQQSTNSAQGMQALQLAEKFMEMCDDDLQAF